MTLADRDVIGFGKECNGKFDSTAPCDAETVPWTGFARIFIEIWLF